MRPWIAVLLLTGCAAPVRQAPPPPAPPGAPEVRAVRAADPPMVDGIANDAAWADAPEAEVRLQGAGKPGPCRLKAVVHGATLYLLIRWKDPTEDRELESMATGPYSPWNFLWTGDVVDLAFPIDGPFPDNPLAPAESTRDLWRWDAMVSDRSGHARDGRMLTTREPGSGTPVDDAGTPPDGRHPPTGSAADVLARGAWEDGEWTVELARGLSTGHPDDRDLGGLLECPLSLLTFDQSASPESWQARFAGPSVLRLLLPPPFPVDHQGPFPEPRGGRPSQR